MTGKNYCKDTYHILHTFQINHVQLEMRHEDNIFKHKEDAMGLAVVHQCLETLCLAHVKRVLQHLRSFCQMDIRTQNSSGEVHNNSNFHAAFDYQLLLA